MNQARQEIGSLLRRYQEAANASDAEALRALYTEDAVLLPGGFPTAVGDEAIKDFYSYVFSMLSINIEIDIQPGQILVQGDLAFATTSSTGTRTITATQETVPENNRELWVLRSIQGTWRISRYMFNKSGGD